MRYATGLCGLLLTAAMVGGCDTVNSVYKQDTGEMPAVPGPPPSAPAPGSEAMAGPEAGPSDPSNGVEFVDPAPTRGSGQGAATEGEAGDGSVMPPPEPVKPRTYTIQKGDSYWKIAKSVYGDGMRMVDIQKANPDIDPNKLQVGDEILLPE